VSGCDDAQRIVCAGPSFLRASKIFISSLCGLPRRRASPPTAMASLQSIPRFLLPRGPVILRPQARAFLPLLPPTSVRHASITPKGLSEEFRRRREAQQSRGAPVIPQPDKYRPPSHSKRTPNRNLENKIYGAPISEEDKKRMATKKYPNMMSPEGTFSHWFLHNRAIHLWITMVSCPLLSHPLSHADPTIHTGHTRLPRHSSMVHGLHLQDFLCPLASYTQRFPTPPLRILVALHRSLQDAHGANVAAVPAAAAEEGGRSREEEAVQAGETEGG
jgi:hypothetical protein